MTVEQAKTALIDLLVDQVVNLTMMSKIELGDDVIKEYKRLREIIYANDNDADMEAQDYDVFGDEKI